MDYGALAQKFGGTAAPAAVATPGGSGVNYASLAGKYGGKSSNSTTPQTPTPSPAPQPAANSDPMGIGAGSSVAPVAKVADFLGQGPLGEGLATAARVATGSANIPANIQGQDLKNVTDIIAAIHKLPADDPATPTKAAHLTNFLKTFYGVDAPLDPTGAQIDPGTALSDKQVIGSAANTAINVASGGSLSEAGGLGDAAKVINKVVAPLDEASAAGRIGNNVIENAAFGAAGGAAQAASDNQSTADTAKQSAISSVLGAIIGGGTQIGAETLKYLTSPQVSESLYNKALGVDMKTQLADRSPAPAMIEQGKIGTKTGLLNDAQKTIEATNGQIKDIITNQSGATTASTQHSNAGLIEQMRQKLTQQYGDTLGAAGIQKLMDDLPVAKLSENPTGTSTTAEVNSLRQKIDSDFVGNGKWISQNQDPVKISAFKTAANTLRGAVQGTDSRLPALYDQLSDAITTRNSLSKGLAKPHALTSMLELLGALGTGTGALLGHAGAAGAAGAAVAGLAGEKALTSAPVQTATAVALDRAGNAITKNGAVLQGAKAVGRIASRAVTRRASSALLRGSKTSTTPSL